MKPCLYTNRTERYSDESNISGYNNNARRSLKYILYGDLYVIGRLWIEVVKTALTGMNMKLIPVVEAAKIPDTPTKPPPMKYTDLPLYQCPHFEYNDHVEAQKKCPDANTKLLHQTLLPHVKYYKRIITRNLCEANCMIHQKYNEVRHVIRNANRDFKQTMRDPNNLTIRQATVAAGGTAGYILCPGGGIPRRIFCTSLGLLTAGALCFPKETDIVFRDVTYTIGKVFIAMCNKWSGGDYAWREKLACKDELPPPPPARKALQCPPPK